MPGYHREVPSGHYEGPTRFPLHFVKRLGEIGSQIFHVFDAHR
jgi:hypothetical protein